MADALLAQITSIIKPSTMAEIATQLGAPERSVASGLSLSAATAFAGLANKAGDPEAMRQIIDTASKTPADAIASGVSGGQLTAPTSSLMSTGRSVLSSLFGGSTNRVADVIGREAGLGSGVTATIMSLGASALLSFIGRRVRDEGMTASSLAGLLNSEAPGLRQMLPPALGDAFSTHAADSARTIDVSPVVAQAVRKERSWVPWVTLPAILAAALWFGLRPRTVEVPAVPMPAVGTSGTIAMPEPKMVVPHAAPDTTAWVDVDRRLLFVTGSAKLQPRSHDQLQSIAVIMKTHPDARAMIAGYTDNVGPAAANLTLSEQRANTVKNELIGMGVDPSRLTAEGYGETHPIGDNSTEAGRTMNRRISMRVTQQK